MAKISTVVKNEKRKKLALKQLKVRKELRAQVVDSNLSDDVRDAAKLKLSRLTRNGSAGRVRNRCVVTGRSRAVYRKFGLSRIKFRELAHKGLIPGVIKASW